MSIAAFDAVRPPVAAAGDAGSGTFAYCSQQYRVLFGAGTSARLGEEAERLGIKRALVLTSPEQQDLGHRLGAGLGDRLAGLFAGARMHTPVEVTNEALRIVESATSTGWSRSAAARRSGSARHCRCAPGCRISPSRPPMPARR